MPILLSSVHENHVTPDSVIIYRAYMEKIDEAAHETRLRILAFSQCHINAESNISIRTPDGRSYRAIPNPIEGKCPWGWAPNCTWNSFILDAHVQNVGGSYDRISISHGNRNVVLPAVKRDGIIYDLAICVPPLYWYTEWVRFIEFVEIWKTLGATHFYVYYQSVSKLLYSILREYQKSGVVSLIDWIELPKSTEVDPNKSLYRLGHSLAHNDCLMRSRAKFVALVDIDEIIVPSTRNQSLLDFLKASLKTHPLAGSFLFKHARLRFPAAKIKPETDLAHLDFRWLLSATADLKNGPAKVIFMSERADVVLTHRVRFHRKPFSEVEVSDHEAILYHSRSNWKNLNTSDTEENTTVPFIKNWFNEDLRREVVRSYNKIIGNIKDPGLLKTSLYSKSPHVLRQCIDKYIKKFHVVP